MSKTKKIMKWKPDPRQRAFLSYLLDRNSETFSNVLESGLKAGFKYTYAKNLTDKMPNWLSEAVQDGYMVKKSAKNLAADLDIPDTSIVLDNEKKPMEIVDWEGRKLRNKTSMFVLERLDKVKWAKLNENINANVSVHVSDLFTKAQSE